MSNYIKAENAKGNHQFSYDNEISVASDDGCDDEVNESDNV